MGKREKKNGAGQALRSPAGILPPGEPWQLLLQTPQYPIFCPKMGYFGRSLSKNPPSLPQTPGKSEQRGAAEQEQGHPAPPPAARGGKAAAH